jgi:eukaryotic-like serine/threonine-protein kinase
MCSGDGTLYALNASTGSKIWSYATRDLESSPTVVDGVVFVGSRNGNV